MSRGPKTATDLQEAIKTLVSDARWNGLSKETIRALLKAESETVE